MPTSWLAPPSGIGWPTTATDVPGTCTRLGLPSGWEPDDVPGPVEGEASYTYRGNSPVEWLTVRYRETEADGDIAQWVGGTLRAIGFPVIPPGRVLIDLPRLDDWSGGPLDDQELRRLGVDELRGEQGTATWRGDPDGVRRLRLYVISARRGRQSWLIALSLETATTPDMSVEEVTGNDHVRAAAVLAPLVLTAPAPAG